MKTVCMIGKPNTGKSSLFNILIKEKKSIIMDQPGITRDRIYGQVNYQDKKFSLIDTGGLEDKENDFQKNILIQATYAIDEADIILFIVDGKSELTQSDYKIRDMLMKSQKRVIVVVNKLDNKEREEEIYRFYELGFETIIGISCAHKKGITTLLEEITKEMNSEEQEEKHVCRFSFIGRPNVGKSSLVNALLNEERAIVSDVAGTTRDASDAEFYYNKEKYICVDTAGIRKQGKIYESVEKYSYLRSMKAIEDSDVCVLVLDASQGIIEMDKHIAGMAIEQGKALVLCVNKWDLVENSNEKLKEWQTLIKYEFQFIAYAKVVFLSAKTKKRMATLMPEIIASFKNYQKMIPTSMLNQIIEEATSIHEAPSYKGRRLKIYFVSQESSEPPKFIFSVNDKGLVHFSYQRYLENQLRSALDLSGTPIIIKFKNKKED